MKDVAWLAAVHARAFEVDRAWSEAEFHDLLREPKSLLVSYGEAFVLGRVIADEAEILTLATDPGHWRQGLARRCLADFEAACGVRGARFVFLEVAADNAAASALYDSAGYTMIGRRRDYYARNGKSPVDALMLRKELGTI